jgi:hypothetical protein
MFEPTDELTIRLSVAEWNQIMGMLGEQKYSLVNELIRKINEQATAQHDAGARFAGKGLPADGPPKRAGWPAAMPDE